MGRSLFTHCFALAALGVCIPALHAQDNLLDDLYGRGVHAYFSRNYEDAYKHLSDAATSGSQDPRVFYFRALTDLRLNKADEATADLKKATELEYNGDAPFQVSKALERVQGNERLMIEDVRAKARLAIRNAAEERAKIRYQDRIKAEAKVLRNPPAAGAEPAPPAVAAEEVPPSEPAAEKPAAPAKPATDDPFGEAPAGEAPAKPAVPAEESPAPPAKPAAEDPFGEAPAKPAAPAAEKPEEPAEEKPAAPAKPAVEDPFGDTPAKPAAPAAETPAEEAPGGEVKPASATEPAAASGKGSVLGSFFRAVTKAVPGEAKAGAPQPPAAEEAPIPKGDPNAPDPFGDAPAAKPAPPAAAPAAKPAASDPFADDPPAAPAGKAPAKPAETKPAEVDPFK